MIYHIDKAAPTALQEDSTPWVTELTTRVHLSTTPCWRRVALLIAQRLNAGATVLVDIIAVQRTAVRLKRFCSVVGRIPETIGVYRMSRRVKSRLKLVVPHTAAYGAVYKRSISALNIFDAGSGTSMEIVKHATRLPVDNAS